MQLAPYNQTMLDQVTKMVLAMEPVVVVGMHDSGIDFLYARWLVESSLLKDRLIVGIDWSNGEDWQEVGLASRMGELAREVSELPEQAKKRWGYDQLEPIKERLKVNNKVGDVEVLLTLTPNEKMVWDLLRSKVGQMTTREEVARVLWGAEWEQKYSDWAIDQVVSQLRSKMPLVDYTGKIVTKRGLGYVYQSS